MQDPYDAKYDDDPSKSLKYLQELTTSEGQGEEFIISTAWPRLEKLCIVCTEGADTGKIMKVIAKAFEKGLLPRLRAVDCLLLFVTEPHTESLDLERLNEHGIILTMMKVTEKRLFRPT